MFKKKNIGKNQIKLAKFYITIVINKYLYKKRILLINFFNKLYCSIQD